MRARSGWLAGLDPVVALWSMAIVAGLVLFGALAPGTAAAVFDAVQDAILAGLGWWYIVLASATVGLVLWLAVSKAGEVRLGGDDSRPEFDSISWFAMLFGTGMGIGLMFWGVAEPVSHFADNPFVRADADAVERARVAMRLTFFHWGLHPWAIYALVAVALGYFAYRRGLPLTIRSALYPLIGEGIHGWAGRAVDVMAIVATTVGAATSLGLGVQQMNTGLEHVVGWKVSFAHSAILIAVITAIAVVSVVSGIERGIKLLSHVNLWLAVALLVLVAALGPTASLIDQLVESTGDYLQNLLWLSFWTDAYENRGWQAAWTTFYWAWWISWAPFVGMFIARISRGRTIRELVFGVLLAPTLVTFVWLTVFGGTALASVASGDPGGLADAVARDVTISFYALLEQLDMGGLGWGMAASATLLVALFFITGADSGTLVINTILAVGEERPPLAHRVLWGAAQGVVAAVLLSVGGLAALQAATISLALPFSVVMVVMAAGLVVGLRREAPGDGSRGRGAASAPPALAAAAPAQATEDAHGEAR